MNPDLQKAIDLLRRYAAVESEMKSFLTQHDRSTLIPDSALRLFISDMLVRCPESAKELFEPAPTATGGGE